MPFFRIFNILFFNTGINCLLLFSMSLFISSLNSGSNGNCYYIGNTSEAILVDAGISCRETESRLLRLGLDVLKVKAIFISHEHSDHIKGVETLSKKYRLPVYITKKTELSGRLKLEPGLVKPFTTNKKIKIGELTVIPFSKMHDAADPYSFTVSGHGVNIGVYTDIGTACSQLATHFKTCHAAFLEANYCEEMLESGSYPFFLKQRIRGESGHLSNHQALELFRNHRSTSLSLLLLSHLSKNNNSPRVVSKMFKEHADSTKIVIASRDKETEVYEINAGDNNRILTTAFRQKTGKEKAGQLSLF